MDETYTADGKIVRKGDRVFNYYDLEWGTIESEIGDDGWFTFASERVVGRATLLNGERISSFEPQRSKR